MQPTEIGPGCPTVTQDFGPTSYEGEWYCPTSPTGRWHDGVDVAGVNCCGTPVLAVGDGLVQALGQTWPGSDGLGPGAILIRMDDGKYAGYGHGFPEVSIGQRVTKGQRIGRVGTQGNSTGCHVHLMIRNQLGTIPGGVDPLKYTGPSGSASPTPEAPKEETVKQTLVWDEGRNMQHFVYLVPTGGGKANVYWRAWIGTQGKMTEPKAVGDDLDDNAGVSACLFGAHGEQLSVFCRAADTSHGTGRHFWTSGDLANWSWQAI